MIIVIVSLVISFYIHCSFSYRTQISTVCSIHGENKQRLRKRSQLRFSSINPIESNLDVIIIGSGIGGLCSAALLANQGMKVAVFESHYEIGGVAHEFLCNEDGRIIPSDQISNKDERLYRFEAGPSLYSGLSIDRSPNPLKHVFQIIGEEPNWITYRRWKAFLPEAPEGFDASIGALEFERILRQYSGESAIDDWKLLSDRLRPLAKGVMSFPSMAMRPDLGAIQTLLLRYPWPVLNVLLQGQRLTRPFSEIYQELGTSNKFLKNYLNLLCFLLQGLPAEGTLTAVMAYMVEDFFRPNAVMDYPEGGSHGIAAALERGIVKNGGVIHRRAHVEEVLVEGDRAVGVRLRNGRVYNADVAVISNCDLKTTYNLVPPGKFDRFDQERLQLEGSPLCNSFMHLHIGIDSSSLPDNIPPQWTVCNSWDQPIDAPGNVIVVSMPSLLDPKMAPTGRHVIHAYTAGNEPYELWEPYKHSRGSSEYNKLKEERCKCLWEAIEREIPDVRSRVKVQFVGSPLTHERFNRRYRGNYGPAIEAGKGSFPGQLTPIRGYLRCGDSTNPGIGVPAVASSGSTAAVALLSVKEHMNILDRIRL